MSHEHEAVYLAVASLDFELSPDERRRMEIGLAECPECAEIAASHVDLARLLDRLPVHDASPQVRQRVMRAALVPPQQRQWPILLVAAALLGLLIAAAGAAGAFRERQPLDQSVVPPSASIPALGDLASPVPSSSLVPGSTEAPGSSAAFVAGPPLAADTIAEVVSGRLRIRSAPRIADDSIKHEPLLDVGDRLLILDGPVVASDYEWYQVMAWRPGNLYASWPIGWVSRGDHGGRPWIRASADPCPTGAITMAVVEALHPQERVACFGDQPLRLRAYVTGQAGIEPCVPEPGTACIDGPAWLTGFGGSFAQVDTQVDTPSIGGPQLAIDPNGRLPPSALPSGVMVDLVGAFDHPAARDCRPGSAGPDATPLDAAEARMACRARFVVTDVRSDPDYPMADTAGIAVTDNLRVRSDPGLDGDRYELLPIGTRVWIVDGPVLAADYEWFHVIVPSIDVGAGAPRVGWVAASDHGAEPWLARRTVECPDGRSLDVADLMRLTSPGYGDEGFACFGSSTIRFEGTVATLCGVEDRPGWEMTPEWLSGNAGNKLTIRDGDAFVVAHPRPGLSFVPGCGQVDAQPSVLEGHFGDDAAWECEAAIPGREEPDDLYLVTKHWCEVTLVIDRLSPLPVPTASPPPG
jgi:hypothetical protein